MVPAPVAVPAVEPIAEPRPGAPEPIHDVVPVVDETPPATESLAADPFPASHWFQDSGGKYLQPTQASAGKVLAAVAAKKDKVDKCWLAYGKSIDGSGTSLVSSHTFSLLITPGSKSKVEVVKAGPGQEELVKCVSNVLKAILFPSPLRLDDSTSMKKGWSLGLILIFPPDIAE